MPRTVKHNDLKRYIEAEGGTLMAIMNGNYNIRFGQRSRNIGRPKNGRWNAAQLRRAWGNAVGIAKPRWL